MRNLVEDLLSDGRLMLDPKQASVKDSSFWKLIGGMKYNA